jgi:predicted ATPase/DNA-binding winged helix-turn-helix (wHTH) protein/Tfp pilus assembly protein PilF
VPPERYSFGPFELDVTAFRLSRGGEVLPLQPKALELLVMLLRAGGALVSREEIQAALWPDVAVTENSMRQVVRRIREVLGEEHAALIETVPRKGLRLVIPSETPPPLPSPELPVPRDELVGRQEELAWLAQRLAEGARLITVTGPGGAGKTRLVLQYARQHPGQTWLCELAEARSRDDLVRIVAGALGVTLEGSEPLHRLTSALASRGPGLLVLDNFEQLVPVADALEAWLDRCPVQLLVTSRQTLGLRGEHVLPLGPLREEHAVQLFVQRARAISPGFAPSASPGFALSGAELSALSALVRLLDGLPLAIELAAARIRVMPVQTLLSRMGERFQLLATQGARSSRHSTLEATLDWSWELLEEGEQRALAQLSVMEGSFSLEAAEAVVGRSGVLPLDLVQALVERSLVRPQGEGRMDLLVSVQAYAGERLRELGELAPAQARHAAYFAGLPPRELHPQDLANVTAAARCAWERRQAVPAAQAALGAWELLSRTGPFVQGADLLEAALALPDQRAPWLLELHREAGWAQRRMGRLPQAREHLEVALALAREATAVQRGEVLDRLGCVLAEQGEVPQAQAHFEQALALASGDLALQAQVSCNLANLHRHQGRPWEALAQYEVALSAYHELGDEIAEALVHSNLGVLHFDLGRTLEARASYERARATFARTGRRHREASVLGDLGALHHRLGELQEARACYAAALLLHRESGSASLEAMTLSNLGGLHLQQGQPLEARPLLERALLLARTTGARRLQGNTLVNLACLLESVGEPTPALTHLEEALAIHQSMGNRHMEGVVLGILGLLHGRMGGLEQARRHLGQGERLLREVGDRAELGKLLCSRAEIEGSREALEEAEALARAIGAGEGSELWGRIAELRGK